MKMLSFLLFFCAFSFDAFSGDIDYDNRQLIKALTKGAGSFELNELEIPASLAPNSEGKYFQVTGSGSSSISFAYVGRVNSCRAGGCSAPGVEANSGFEYFDYYILFNTRGAVEQVKVFNYMATHGQEITLKAWLRQFQDHSVDQDLTVGKQVDGIAGATISVHAITEDVREKTALLRQLVEIQYTSN